MICINKKMKQACLVVILFIICNAKLIAQDVWCNKSILDSIDYYKNETYCDSILKPEADKKVNELINSFPFFTIKFRRNEISVIEFDNSYGMDIYSISKKNLFKYQRSKEYFFILRYRFKEILKSDTCFLSYFNEQVIVRFNGIKKPFIYTNKYKGSLFTQLPFFKMYVIIANKYSVTDIRNNKQYNDVIVKTDNNIENFPSIPQYVIGMKQRKGQPKYWFLYVYSSDGVIQKEEYIIEIVNGDIYLYDLIKEKVFISVPRGDYEGGGFEDESIKKGDLIFKFSKIM